jgi:hypothetical protein
LLVDLNDLTWNGDAIGTVKVILAFWNHLLVWIKRGEENFDFWDIANHVVICQHESPTTVDESAASGG